MGGARVLLLQVDDLSQATALHLGRDVVLELAGRVGDGAVAVLEHEGRVEAHRLHERQGLRVVLLGLAAKADHQIGAQGDVGHRRAQLGHELEELRPRVAPAHALEHRVRAHLGREVHVGADLGLLGQGRDDRVGEVDGVGARESNPLDAVDAGHRAKEPREVAVLVAVGVHRLAEQ